MMSEAPKTVLTVFAAVPQAVGDARAFTRRVLDSWGLAHLTETAILLVSELATNALAHAGSVVETPGDAGEPLGAVASVILGISLRESLWIEVWDQSSAPPVRRVAADDAESGRGLELVDALSKEWGCDVLTAGGKIVWFVLDAGRS